MFKKFIEGLVFGCGFAIAFISIYFIASYFIYPKLINSRFEQATTLHSDEHFREPAELFPELTLEEQIKNSSVIVLAKYEPSTDGRMKAILKEFLKKESGVTVHYKIGDEYSPSSYYPNPKGRIFHGDGVVIFFTGSPAVMKMSMTYSGNRIDALGDMPLELLKKKCKE